MRVRVGLESTLLYSGLQESIPSVDISVLVSAKNFLSLILVKYQPAASLQNQTPITKEEAVRCGKYVEKEAFRQLCKSSISMLDTYQGVLKRWNKNPEARPACFASKKEVAYRFELLLVLSTMMFTVPQRREVFQLLKGFRV